MYVIMYVRKVTLLRMIPTMNYDEDHRGTSLAFYLTYILAYFVAFVFGILFGIYPDICSTILSDIFSATYFGILFGGWVPAALQSDPGGGPGVRLDTRPSCAHDCDWTLGFEV